MIVWHLKILSSFQVRRSCTKNELACFFDFDSQILFRNHLFKLFYICLLKFIEFVTTGSENTLINSVRTNDLVL